MSVVQDVKIHTPTHDVFAGPEGGVLSLPWRSRWIVDTKFQGGFVLLFYMCSSIEFIYYLYVMILKEAVIWNINIIVI